MMQSYKVPYITLPSPDFKRVPQLLELGYAPVPKNTVPEVQSATQRRADFLHIMDVVQKSTPIWSVFETVALAKWSPGHGNPGYDDWLKASTMILPAVKYAEGVENIQTALEYIQRKPSPPGYESAVNILRVTALATILPWMLGMELVLFRDAPKERGEPSTAAVAYACNIQKQAPGPLDERCVSALSATSGRAIVQGVLEAIPDETFPKWTGETPAGTAYMLADLRQKYPDILCPYFEGYRIELIRPPGVSDDAEAKPDLTTPPRAMNERRLKRLCQPGQRFVIVIVQLVWPEQRDETTGEVIVEHGGAHRNLIVYDREKQHSWWYEPHGTQKYISPENGETIARWIFTSSTKFSPSTNFCPRRGDEGIQGYIEDLAGSPRALCAMWSWWYLENHLRNPDLSRVQIQEMVSVLSDAEIVEIIKSYVRRLRQAQETESFVHFYTGYTDQSKSQRRFRDLPEASKAFLAADTTTEIQWQQLPQRDLTFGELFASARESPTERQGFTKPPTSSEQSSMYQIATGKSVPTKFEPEPFMEPLEPAEPTEPAEPAKAADASPPLFVF
jgi:hypothetical protein